MMIDDAALVLTRCNARINYIRHISDANSTSARRAQVRADAEKRKTQSLHRGL